MYFSLVNCVVELRPASTLPADHEKESANDKKSHLKSRRIDAVAIDQAEAGSAEVLIGGHLLDLAEIQTSKQN